jgi:hypothetical protein
MTLIITPQSASNLGKLPPDPYGPLSEIKRSVARNAERLPAFGLPAIDPYAIVGYWPFRFLSRFLRSNTAYDVSLYGNHGTLQGGPTWVNRGLEFDGSDDYVKVEDNPTLSDISHLTISNWVYFYSTGTQSFIDKDDEWSIFYDRYGNQDINWATYGANIDCGHSGLPTNEWHYVSIVWNKGSDVSSYINNTQYLDKASYTETSGDSSNPVRIGVGTSGSNLADFVNGKIDDARIYNRALTPDQIAFFYAHPYYLLQRVPRPLIFDTASGGTTVTQSVAGSLGNLSGALGETVTFTQALQGSI